ncbi:MAG: hypothetical protein KJO43_09105, partial [Phycisphaerae bacterium]|nr:hypothetical protein [Phycisphaerae bacterium]
MTNPASRITSVRPLPSDPGTVSVRVDGRVVGRVAVEMVDRLALAPGASWSTERAAAFARAAATDATRRAALGCLRRRSRSTASLRAWLTERGHDIGVIAEVIGDLHARGLLDDERHGRDLARALLARRPAAWRFLVERLEQS